MKEIETALLRKYLQGNCSAEELRQVQQLLQQEGSRFTIDRLMDELYAHQWASAESAEEQSPVDTETMQQQLLQQAAETLDVQQEHSSDQPRISFFGKWKTAAVWAGLILLSGVIYRQVKKTNVSDEPVYAEQTNNSHLPKSFTLPDSSVVYLGAGASVRYVSSFGRTSRKLSLDGQAFFEVRSNKNHPFTVSTGQVETIVLGTSFKIDAFAGQPVVIAVATGKVSVNRKDQRQQAALAVLTQGRKLTWDETTGKSAEASVETYGLEQWKSGELIFDEQPLAIVFRELEKRYRCTIQVAAPALNSYRISGMFPAGESLQQIMKVLSVTGKFNFNTADKQVYQVSPKSGR